MIAERDAHGRSGKKNQEERHLKPIQPEMPEIQRQARERDEQGDDEEKACGPVDSVKRDSRHSLYYRSCTGVLKPP